MEVEITFPDGATRNTIIDGYDVTNPPHHIIWGDLDRNASYDLLLVDIGWEIAFYDAHENQVIEVIHQ
jgi:hypothetical protein